jgi:hypothetical protein
MVTDNCGMSTANLPSVAGLTQGLAQALAPALSRMSRPSRSGAWGRIENWFRRATVGRRAAPIRRPVAETTLDTLVESLNSMAAVPSPEAFPEAFRPRARFSRRRSRHRADDVQDTSRALTELMADLRDGMARQSARQDELLAPLAQLPGVLRESVQDSQARSLGAIHEVQGQVERQGAQQWQIAEILERISRADAEQGRVLDALCRHESSFSENLGRVDENLSRVGDVMQTVGATSEAGARVLERLCDGIHARDAELERAFKSHNRRLTALLSISIGLSVVAIASVAALSAAAIGAFVFMHRTGMR